MHIVYASKGLAKGGVQNSGNGIYFDVAQNLIRFGITMVVVSGLTVAGYNASLNIEGTPFLSMATPYYRRYSLTNPYGKLSTNQFVFAA